MDRIFIFQRIISNNHNFDTKIQFSAKKKSVERTVAFSFHFKYIDICITLRGGVIKTCLDNDGQLQFAIQYSSDHRDPYPLHIRSQFSTILEHNKYNFFSHFFSLSSQSLIEEAWRKGFDVQGSEQLGGKLVNTRKWIGATEIVAFFTAHRIKTELLDFHTPTAKDGTHPKLFQWVLDYFRERARAKAFTPPLYLQHQGHSRTIVGIEVLTSSSQGHGAHGSSGSAEGRNLRLLVFDPSHSKAHMATLSKSSPTSAEAGQVMRMLRKAPASIKCKQYQIVTVGGVFATDKEAAMHKVISSKRVP